MELDKLDQNIGALNSGVRDLLDRHELLCHEQSPLLQQELLVESLDELYTTLEEMEVASEALYQQNEALMLARAAAAEESQRYQDLFEFAPDAYLVTDAWGNIQDSQPSRREVARSLTAVPSRQTAGHLHR